MKRLGRTTALFLVVATLVSLAPLGASAEGPFTIRGSSTSSISTMLLASKHSGCLEDVLEGPLNGIDSYVVNVRSHRGYQIVFSWNADAIAPAAFAGLYLYFWDSRCSGVAGISGNKMESGPNPGSWTLTVPSGATWLLVNTQVTANVRFSFRRKT